MALYVLCHPHREYPASSSPAGALGTVWFNALDRYGNVITTLAPEEMGVRFTGWAAPDFHTSALVGAWNASMAAYE